MAICDFLIQEIGDSGASTGAIYSLAGFTKGAMKKAQARGIGCFQLWRDRPADHPVLQAFCCYWCWDAVTIPVIEPGESGFPPKTWDEFFDFEIEVEGKKQTIFPILRSRIICAKDRLIGQTLGRLSLGFSRRYLVPPGPEKTRQ